LWQFDSGGFQSWTRADIADFEAHQNAVPAAEAQNVSFAHLVW